MDRGVVGVSRIAYEGLILIEPTNPYTASIMKIKNIIVHKKTKYQDIVFADLEFYGRCLIIDNYIQSSEIDEYIYHESLVHPAMVTHPNPRRVLIIGGGEGATLREVLKHNTVEEAVMVDIDGELVEIAKKYLEIMHKGSFDDPRTRVVIMDGREFVRVSKSREYDVVVIDLTDPYSSEIAKMLYSEEFYREIHRILADDGVVVTQAGNSFYYPEVYDYIYSGFSKVFKHVMEYEVWIPAFGYTCNFILGSKTYDPYRLGIEDVDNILKARNVETKYYNGRRHQVFKYTDITRPITRKQ